MVVLSSQNCRVSCPQLRAHKVHKPWQNISKRGRPIMNKIHAAVGLVLACLVAPAFGAGSNPVESDNRSNTAMGTSALGDTFPNISSGQGDTADGAGPLRNNTMTGWITVVS